MLRVSVLLTTVEVASPPLHHSVPSSSQAIGPLTALSPSGSLSSVRYSCWRRRTVYGQRHLMPSHTHSLTPCTDRAAECP